MEEEPSALERIRAEIVFRRLSEGITDLKEWELHVSRLVFECAGLKGDRDIVDGVVIVKAPDYNTGPMEWHQIWGHYHQAFQSILKSTYMPGIKQMLTNQSVFDTYKGLLDESLRTNKNSSASHHARKKRRTR